MSDQRFCDLCERNVPVSTTGGIRSCEDCKERYHRLLSGISAHTDPSFRLSKSKVEDIMGLSPYEDRFLLPLDWHNIPGLRGHTRLTTSTPDKSEQEILTELESVVNTLGTKNALTFLASTRILSKFAYYDPFTDDDVGLPARMFEFSLALIGSFPTETGYHERDSRSYSERWKDIQSVADEDLAGGYRTTQHRVYGAEIFQMYSLLESLYSKLSSEYSFIGENPFRDDESLAAAAQNSELIYGNYAYPEQYIEYVKKIYAPYQYDFLKNKGLDMINIANWSSLLLNESYKRLSSITQVGRYYQADCLRLVGGIQEAIRNGKKLSEYLGSPLHVTLQRGELESWAAFMSTADNKFWMSREEIIATLDIFNRKRVNAFLDRISVSVGSYDVSTPFGFNQLEATPLLEINDQFLFAHPQMFTRALSKSFFYDLNEMNTSPNILLELNFNHRGELLELWSYDRITQLFQEGGNAFHSVSWGNEEIDIVAIFDSIAVITEVKSKFLTDNARKGDIDEIKKDMERGILAGVNQADRKVKNLQQGEWSLEDAIDHESVQDKNITEYLPMVVMGGEYDRLATMDYVSLIDDQTLIPYVVSIYDLDLLSRILNTEHFIKYLRFRRKAAKDGQIHSMDELDFLGLYSKTGEDPYESIPGGPVWKESADVSFFHSIGDVAGAGDEVRSILSEFGGRSKANWLSERERTY